MKSIRITALTLALGTIVSLAAAARADDNLIRAQLVNLPNDKGRVACAIFSSADGFPRDRTKATERVEGPIKNGVGTCEFKGLPAGTYAIASFHDEAETGKMKYNFLGLPQEAYGFSNDAKRSGMTPPSFSACSFSYSGGTTDITMTGQR